MVIWSASYPKNKNTWIRATVTSLIYSEKFNKEMKELRYI